METAWLWFKSRTISDLQAEKIWALGKFQKAVSSRANLWFSTKIRMMSMSSSRKNKNNKCLKWSNRSSTSKTMRKIRKQRLWIWKIILPPNSLRVPKMKTTMEASLSQLTIMLLECNFKMTLLINLTTKMPKTTNQTQI